MTLCFFFLPPLPLAPLCCYVCAFAEGLFGALATINSFPGERMLALRERASGTYCGETNTTPPLQLHSADSSAPYSY
jgi:hypothetical protein